DRGALAAEDHVHRGDVAVAEGVILSEDEDLLAVDVVEEGTGGGDILSRLATRTERVLVDARDGVCSGGARDEEDLVLQRLLGNGERDTRGGRTKEDVDALTDEFLRRGHGGVRVTGVVAVLDVDRGAVDGARTLGDVVQARLESVKVLFAVAGQ